MTTRLPVHEHSRVPVCTCVCMYVCVCVCTYVRPYECMYWSHVRILYFGRRAWTPSPLQKSWIRAWVARLSVHTSKIVKWSIKVISVFERSGTSCLFIKLKLGRVGMGRVLHLGPSWHGPSFMWAELAWAELVLGRVVLHPLAVCQHLVI